MRTEEATSMVNTEGLTLFGAGSEWFWSMLQFVVVAVTLVGIYIQLRQARAANAFAQANAMKQEWDGEQLQRRRLAIWIALRDGGPDADLSDLAIPIANFWESIGGLVQAGHVELAVARDFLGGALHTWWSLLEPAVRATQAEFGSGIYEHFEWFAAETDGSVGARASTPRDAYDRLRLIATSPQRITELLSRIAEMEAMRTVTFAPARPTDHGAQPGSDAVAMASD
jgi:hypothetical protein